MARTQDFEKRVGKVFLPLAENVRVDEHDPMAADMTTLGPITTLNPTVNPGVVFPWKFCRTALKDGCYTFAWTPPRLLANANRGTIRIEHITGGLRFSGDVYSYRRIIIWPTKPIAAAESLALGGPVEGDAAKSAHAETLAVPRISVGMPLEDGISDAPGVIPIYSRASYRSYLKGTTASFASLVPRTAPCTFSLTFDQYDYTQPTTGFSGSFPASPSRTIRFDMQVTSTPDQYTGTVYQGTTALGSVTMTWVSSSYRRASLVVHTLSGATTPPTSVGSEDFHSVFATAGWDMSVTYGGTISLPASLSTVSTTSCWSQANLATLMASVPGYNPAGLDSNWTAHLVAVPGRLGCGRGVMFDTSSGNPNGIAREGAASYSDDGYPTTDSSHFGAAAGGLQKNFPRAFLRSASHEVGHTFNQIHQELELGADNSIMTTTPSVADFLAAHGQTFPNDINLGFNPNVQRHLRHLPDPAVRPGAIDFFGASVAAPQADEVVWPEELQLTVEAADDHLSLGEALDLKWVLSNASDHTVIVPRKVDIDSLAARVSVTNSDGEIVYLRPALQDPCPENPLTRLGHKGQRTGSTRVFWGRDGFTFQKPGKYTVDVILLWMVQGVHVATHASTEVWVDFPTSADDNRISQLMLDTDVGRAVAVGEAAPGSRAAQRIAAAAKISASHPAVARLQKLGIGQKLGLPK